MQSIKFHLKGTAPSMMQSGRLINPFDPATKELRKVTSKRKKTEADHEEMARIEWHANIYFDERIGPYWPAFNIDRMFRDAAALSKRGPDVKRGFMCLDEKVPMLYDGPRDLAALFAARADFVDLRHIKLPGSKTATMRCRPIFYDWSVKFEAAFEEDVLDRDVVIAFANTAGKFIGLSSHRPRYGRFEVVSAV